MATYPLKVKIQKLNTGTETWSDYYETHAKVKKVGGKEYVEAKSVISSSTYNFRVRYCNKIDDLILNTTQYRIIYKNHIYDIKNVDRFEENSKEVTITGEYNEIS